MSLCLRPPREPVALPTAAEHAGEALATLSVRTAFDLLLTSLELPPGSEVLLSEITVPHMERIVREHRLVPVPVPVDARTLGVSPTDVASRLSPQSKLLMVAHLYGSRMPLEDLGELCQQHELLLVEDCAQALTRGPLTRHPAADASLYSFGPIKTATALGGGIALVRDDSLRERMQQVASTWPRQSARSYCHRVRKFMLLKLLSQPWLFGPLVWWIDRTGGNADAFVGHSAKGFPDEGLFDALRQQPCLALEAMMTHRLQHFDEQAIAERTRRGQQLAGALEPSMMAAGCNNPTHTYWVFPLITSEPEQMVAKLRQAGFDASQISGLTVLGDDSDDHWFRCTTFVPHAMPVPSRRVASIAASLARHSP
ncbi:DegT/DnrJ/EryC1/StrS family aminotransferase [Aeoliella mucimassa]|nr:DegT/DnrJ/EryC1/StrS family aminotransferase [Aeoliella mucimassa]